jgi:hypothetical protein
MMMMMMMMMMEWHVSLFSTCAYSQESSRVHEVTSFKSKTYTATNLKTKQHAEN